MTKIIPSPLSVNKKDKIEEKNYNDNNIAIIEPNDITNITNPHEIARGGGPSTSKYTL